MRTMYKVDGFEFERASMAEQAKKEVEGVKYIKEHTRMDQPDMVLKVYNQLIEEHIFSTAVGFSYLRELQDYLYSIPSSERTEILPLPVSDFLTASPGRTAAASNSSGSSKKSPQEKAADRSYRRMFRVSTFLAIVFGLCVIGMFVITALSKDNVTILNYENQIIDRYESWEKELEEREAQLKLREQENQL